MTTLAYKPAQLTWGEVASMMRLATKDKSYQRTPVGVVVGRYIRWLRNEWGATPATVRDYEATLARMSLTLADRELIDVSTEDLREVIDLWAHREAGTRSKVTSHVHAFWGWCEEQGLVAIDPAHRIRRPRGRRKVAKVLPLTARPRLLAEAKEPRDRLGLLCLMTLGLRRAELGGVQFRDFDSDRGWLRVLGKGQKERVLPLRGWVLDELRLCLASDLPAVGRPPEGDDFLLYPIRQVIDGRGPEGQYRYSYRGHPKKRPSQDAVNNWWYKRCQAAGLVGPGVKRGLNMHQARHLFAVDMRRAAGVEAASQALGHADLSTTLGTYGHQDPHDLERAFDRYTTWLQSSVAPEETEEAPGA